MSCPAASRRRSGWRWRSGPVHRSCSSTSRWRASTRWRAGSSSTSWSTRSAPTARPPCCHRTSSPTSSRPATGCWCSAAGGRSSTCRSPRRSPSHRVVDVGADGSIAGLPAGDAAAVVGRFPGPAGERLSARPRRCRRSRRPACDPRGGRPRPPGGRSVARRPFDAGSAGGMTLRRVRLTLRLHRFEVFAFGVALIVLVHRGVHRGDLHRQPQAGCRVLTRPTGDVSAACQHAFDAYNAAQAVARRAARERRLLIVTSVDRPVPGRADRRTRARARHDPPGLVAGSVALALVPLPGAADLVVVVVADVHRGGRDGPLLRGEHPEPGHLTQSFAGYGSRGGLLAARALFIFGVSVVAGAVHRAGAAGGHRRRAAVRRRARRR